MEKVKKFFIEREERGLKTNKFFDYADTTPGKIFKTCKYSCFYVVCDLAIIRNIEMDEIIPWNLFVHNLIRDLRVMLSLREAYDS